MPYGGGSHCSLQVYNVARRKAFLIYVDKFIGRSYQARREYV